MTGCPNGCTRPYMAELALVGSGQNKYRLWLGGSNNLQRLAKPFLLRMIGFGFLILLMEQKISSREQVIMQCIWH